MIEIAFATTNKAKVQSLAEALDPKLITIVQASMELPEPRSDEVEHIAAEKVRHAYGQLGRPVVALDAGFFIGALNGFPKAFVNFALQTIELSGILKLVDGKNRACEFRHALAYLDNNISKPKVFVDYVCGTLAKNPRGTPRPRDWSVLSQVFVPEGQSQTLSEMSDETYRHWRDTILWPASYRKAFAEWISANRGKTK